MEKIKKYVLGPIVLDADTIKRNISLMEVEDDGNLKKIGIIEMSQHEFGLFKNSFEKEYFKIFDFIKNSTLEFGGDSYKKIYLKKDGNVLLEKDSDNKYVYCSSCFFELFNGLNFNQQEIIFFIKNSIKNIISLQDFSVVFAPKFIEKEWENI